MPPSVVYIVPRDENGDPLPDSAPQMVEMDEHRHEPNVAEVYADRHELLLSVSDVEHHIVTAIEEMADEQQFNWAPINRAFEELRECARQRAAERRGRGL